MKHTRVGNRAWYQYAGLSLCLTPLFRLLYLDTEQVRLVVFGFAVPHERIFLLVLVMASLAASVVFMCMRLGRYFCAYLCPIHFFLEQRVMNSSPATSGRMSKAKRSATLLRVLAALLLAEAALSFVLSYRQQWVLYTAGGYPPRILFAYAILAAAMLGILVFYEERFCQSACPAAVFQNLCRTETTEATVFDHASGHCVDCEACDSVCPMRLDVREQSSSSLCTNCGLCVTACTRVLSEQHLVLAQTRGTAERSHVGGET